MIWNETKECMSRDEMEFLQSKRLVKTVDRVYNNVDFSRDCPCSCIFRHHRESYGGGVHQKGS